MKIIDLYHQFNMEKTLTSKEAILQQVDQFLSENNNTVVFNLKKLLFMNSYAVVANKKKSEASTSSSI